MNHNFSLLAAGVSNKKVLALLAILTLQAVAMFAFRMEETIPPLPDLDRIPQHIGEWKSLGTDTLDAATEAILKPDKSLIRAYREAKSPVPASLFVGYFKTSQANHPAPHAPIHCLPGAGWREIYETPVSLSTGGGRSFTANEYVVEKSGQKLVVVYWYQNRQRTWTSHALGKVYTLPDFLRYRRTDVALVRVTMLAPDGNYEALLGPARNFSASVQPLVHERFLEGLSPVPDSHPELH